MGRRKIEDCSVDELFKMLETLEHEISTLENTPEIGWLSKKENPYQKQGIQRVADLKEKKFYCRRILREKLLKQSGSPYVAGKKMLRSEGFKKDVYREVFVSAMLENPSPLPIDLIDAVIAELHIDDLASLAERFQGNLLGERCSWQLQKTEVLLYKEFEEMLDEAEIQATLRRQQISVVSVSPPTALEEESPLKPNFYSNRNLEKAHRQKRLEMNRRYKKCREEE